MIGTFALLLTLSGAAASPDATPAKAPTSSTESTDRATPATRTSTVPANTQPGRALDVASSGPAAQATAAGSSAATSLLASSLSGTASVVSPLAAQGREQQTGGLRFVWREHPSLRAGRWLRLDFSTRLHWDRMRAGDDPSNFDDAQLRRARVGLDGELFRVLQFSIERELTDAGDLKLSAKSTKTPWRDVYGELKLVDGLQLRGGRFKIPFGLDQLTSISNNDLIFRTLGATYLTPARDIGGMIHGDVLDNAFGYAAGVFQHDGDNSRSTKVAGGDQTIALRMTVRPFKRIKAGNLDRAEFGGNVATTDVSDRSELPNGLRGRTVMSDYTFFEPVFVRGTRRRYGGDIDWDNGPISARAEFIVVNDGRENQGLRNETLEPARARAYHAQVAWVLTGDRKQRPLEPKNPLPMRGAGAVEIAARYERLWFDSQPTGEPAFSNSRAEVILPSGDKVITLGVNWYLNRWMKLQLNGIREELQDRGRTPLADGGTKFWSTVFRAQMAL